MAFIKSHSNYILKKRHQDVSDGTIWERDITTIGGVNQFAPGQTPIYRSSNFIITVRDDGRSSNQYNQTKWKENEDSGYTWTLENLSGMTSDFKDQNDTKIVLKQDYYDLRDFAYYGSLSELLRASINNILSKFPGELFHTNENAYYIEATTEDFEKIEEAIQIGSDSGYTYFDNPFSINLHSKVRPNGDKEIKYFTNDGYQNYEIIKDNIVYSITDYNVEYYDVPFCIGNQIATVRLKGENENDSININIDVWVGDEKAIVYMSQLDSTDLHIRPKEIFFSQFYNELDNFERLLLNPKTTPKYKASFAIIKENSRGYYKEIEDFIFPTTYGGYNLDATTDIFSNYALRFSEIGLYYDEYFTDNLYRSMTHESIKNFDWTYTRKYNEGDEEEYIHGGEKIQKALRIFAREFDEILSYINNIKNVNRVTYDEISNIPDYFLTDEVKNKGWDVKMVYPYSIESNIKETSNDQLNNIGYRKFYQNTKKEIKPYSNEYLDYPNGYFITCDIDSNVKTPYWYESDEEDAVEYGYREASANDTVSYDKTRNRLSNKIKSYSDNKTYTYMEANKMFMRQLAINSPYILRHKGTVEGIEMILGMFGLKSDKWVKRLSSNKRDVKADYKIIEYSSFTERIEEKWDAVHQMYRTDWFNSTKSIVYDYRSVSNYTRYGAPTNYLSYQGLPIAYRDEYLSAEKPYIKVSQLERDMPQEVTDNPQDAFKAAETAEPIRRRYLYPSFIKDEQKDGNPYFQMNGGWMPKTVENGNSRYNFQFDVEDNIAYTDYAISGETYYADSGETIISGIKDNHPLFKETVRNIKRVDNISELISTPQSKVQEGTVYYVSNIERNSAVINGYVYPIQSEIIDGKVYNFVTFTKNGGYVKVGDDLYFDNSICVYSREDILQGSGMTTYMLEDKPNGYNISAYIKDNGERFVCQDSEARQYTIDSFCVLDDIIDEDTTNYFVIGDPYYANRINNQGWRILRKKDPEYIKINTIINYYKGNNPHNGNMVYDNGHEYFTYFQRLFKYAADNGLFDERCYENFYDDLDLEINNIGFRGLINPNENIKQYQEYLIEDSKIHYFGSYYADNQCVDVKLYGEDKNKASELKKLYNTLNERIKVSSYILNDNVNMINGSPYSGETNADEVTNQIVNNKRLTIEFYLHNSWYSYEGQCEIKYLDDIVMNYLSQMIPSTAIVDIRYIGKENKKAKKMRKSVKQKKLVNG